TARFPGARTPPTATSAAGPSAAPSQPIHRLHLQRRSGRPANSECGGQVPTNRQKYCRQGVLLDQNPSFPATWQGSLATASLSRNYRLNTGFALTVVNDDGMEVIVVENEASDPAEILVLRRCVGDRTYAVGDSHGPRPGPCTAATGHLPGRELQRQAAGCAVCLRLHRVRL